MMEHTKGPWEVGQRYPDTIYDENAEVIGKCYSLSEFNADSANARRIVACVNYCEGLDTNGMETAVTIGDAAAAMRDRLLEKQLELICEREQLLSALNQSHMALIGYLPGHRNEITDAAIEASRAAIAMVTK